MAIDRERRGVARIITRVTYSKESGDLMRREKLKVKDEDGVVHVISNVETNVGRKADYKRTLVDRVKEMEDEMEEDYGKDIVFLNEQITDIEAL
jgi:hypothetical protein